MKFLGIQNGSYPHSQGPEVNEDKESLNQAINC